MTIHIRHRTASGRLDEAWSFDPDLRVVEVLTRLGNAPLVFTVAVCSPVSPRMGAHPILRVNGESWRVLPVRFVRIWPGGVEALVAIPCPVVGELGPGCALMLTNTPPDVDALIEQLGDDARTETPR